MAILTTIDKIPLFSTIQEALAWAWQNNLDGYHTHEFEGKVGYMGGYTHSQAVPNTLLNSRNANVRRIVNTELNQVVAPPPPPVITPTPITPIPPTPIPTPQYSPGSSGSSSGSGGGGGGGY
tara:strand:+ start:336 stop:701 length:366 start_codon:yes stop_codon:yes gene_type:complete